MHTHAHGRGQDRDWPAWGGLIPLCCHLLVPSCEKHDIVPMP